MPKRSKLDEVIAQYEQRAKDLTLELAMTKQMLETLTRGKAITAPKPRTRRAKAPDVPGQKVEA